MGEGGGNNYSLLLVLLVLLSIMDHLLSSFLSVGHLAFFLEPRISRPSVDDVISRLSNDRDDVDSLP